MKQRIFDSEYFEKYPGCNGKEYKLSLLSDSLFHHYVYLIKSHFCDKKIKILDIGCAYGIFLGKCDQEGWGTYGIDVSEFALKRAKKNTKATLYLHDVEDSSIPLKERFDVITMFDIVEHLRYPKKALTNVYKLLDQNGLLIITTPNPKSYFWKEKIGYRNKDPTHISLKKPKEWKKLLEECGFEVCSLKTIMAFEYIEKINLKDWLKYLIGKFLNTIKLGAITEIVSIKSIIKKTI
jgi:2-polyprenyl-3-methyl-5-hydroxy-6-metoxy-1,4-benzoquinol methylase